jgi:hypothetical protein
VAASNASGAWTVEEEKKLASAVETFGAVNWANIATNVPGRNEAQCWEKWHRMSRKAVTTPNGTWTLEEEKKLVSAVETFGTVNWAKIAVNVPGRSETQCSHRWQYLSKKAVTTASGTWTVEEEKKLVSATETFGSHNWTKVAANVSGRNESQCYKK